MAKVQIDTLINAPIEICFDLARSIEFHTHSTGTTNEKAVAEKTLGLIELDEIVTWEANHFFIRQQLTSKITAFDYPYRLEMKC